MLTDDLYNVMANIASSMEEMMKDQKDDNNDNANSLISSIDKLCKVVSNGKTIDASQTLLGLVTSALCGESDKIEEGANALSNSIESLSSSLEAIGESSNDIVESSNNISQAMITLSEGIESIGIKTLYSSYIAKATFPLINAFVLKSIELFSSITSKEKELEKANNGLESLNNSFSNICSSTGYAVLGGLASIVALPMLIPIGAFVMGSSLIFTLSSKLFDSKNMKESSEAISSMAKGIRELSLSAIIVSIASPFFVIGIASLVPLSLFVLGVSGLNNMVNTLFGKKTKWDAMENMAKGILYMSLAASAAIITAPLALIATPCVLVLGLFTLAIGTLVVKPMNKLVGSKEFKGFTKGILSMTLGILTLGIAATSAIMLSPIMLLGSLAMLATGLFINMSAKVFQKASKHTKDYIKGTLGLVAMSAGFLATSFLLVQAVKIGKDLLTFDTLGVMGIIAATSYGGAQLMKTIGKGTSSILKGSLAVLMVAGTVYGAATLFNKAVVECKGLIEDPTTTIEGLLALIGAVGVMGASIAAAGLALAFIAPGAAAIALVSGTVYMAASSLSKASEAWTQSQQSGAFEIDSNGQSNFSKSISGVISSMIDATKDIDDIDKVGESIKAIEPVASFVQKLAVGVSEFSKIALMKGEISDGKGKRMPFDLTKVGEGIGAIISSIVGGISNALKSFSFEDKDMVEITSGGFLGIGSTTTKIPKQIASISHLVPLATFIGSLASGVSEFSKIATMQGDISIYDEEKKAMVKRPFNLKDVGNGISAIITSLMDGISQAMASFEEGGMSEITSGGILGIGGDKIMVPTRLLNLQHIMPLANFVSSIATMVSSLGKDKDNNATSNIGETFSSLISSFSIDGIDDKLESAGDGIDEITSPLSDFCDIKWSNLPNSENISSFISLLDYTSNIDEAKSISISNGSKGLVNLAQALSGDNIIGEDIATTTDGIERSITAINDLDSEKAKTLTSLYNSIANAASKKKDALKAVVDAIKESTDALIEAISSSPIESNNVQLEPIINKNVNNVPYRNNTDNNFPIYSDNRNNNLPISNIGMTKQKVSIDLTINGQGGDSWVIKRR